MTGAAERAGPAPRVSVLIGVYNNATTLKRAASSILAQSLADFELVILDDGSTDSTGAVVAGLIATDARVRAIAMGKNVGISRSLNAGLQAARAPYVAVLDADDWASPRRLEQQLEVLEATPSIAVVGCRMREVDEAGRELRPRTVPASGDVNDVLMSSNPIPNTAAMFRREAALAVGGYDPRYRWASDYDLWLRLAEHHRIVVISDVLATRQMSNTNVAARREREQIREAITMRLRAMARRRSMRGATGLTPYVVSYVTPLSLKRARRRRLHQAP